MNTKPSPPADRTSDDWRSCYQTAEHFYALGDYAEAFSWYKKASVLPHCNPIVFFELGYLFQHGEGVDSDSIEALKWYEKAASLGVPQAMYNLAYFYQNGLVVDRDLQKAAQLLREATSQMDHLQLERDSYEIWIADCNAQLAQMKTDTEEQRSRAEKLDLQNCELNLELSVAKRECQRLEQDVAQTKLSLQNAEKERKTLYARAESAQAALQEEQKARIHAESMASANQAQMKERLSYAETLISNLVKEHNGSFERIQTSCAAQTEQIEKLHKADVTMLKEANDQLHEKNVALFQSLSEKIEELKGTQNAIQQLQTQLEHEKKGKETAFALIGLLLLLSIVLIVYFFFLFG